jgi:hypothetical protein
MTVVDPYPRISPEYVVEELEGLKVRYGAGNVMPEEGQVNVKVQHSDRQDSVSLTLTIEQAKFLAANPISLKDLANENYPLNWPADVRPKKAIPRPADRGAVPIEFAPPKD